MLVQGTQMGAGDYILLTQKYFKMEKKPPHQIVITTNTTNVKQKFPRYLIISLAAGAITGVAAIFGLFLGIELLLGF